MADALDAVDRALKTHKRRSRIVSAVIVLLGLVVIGAVMFTPERRRARAAGGLEVGDDSAAVFDALGAPGGRCLGAGVDHLVSEFPRDVPRDVRDRTLLRLRRETAARWLWPGRGDCGPAPDETEVGIDSAGRVLWVLPATGRVPLVYTES
jgi:hypothetical protein